MRVVVGSTNAVKIEAVAEALAAYPELLAKYGGGLETRGVEVPSGVGHQPETLEATILGAGNRARAAMAAAPSDLAFGIESGMFDVPGLDEPMNHTVCVIFDGKETTAVGFSPAFLLPSEVMRIVKEEGLELRDAAIKAGFTEPPADGRHGQGILGVLTHGRVTRKDYTAAAVHMALIRLH